MGIDSSANRLAEESMPICSPLCFSTSLKSASQCGLDFQLHFEDHVI